MIKTHSTIITIKITPINIMDNSISIVELSPLPYFIRSYYIFISLTSLFIKYIKKPNNINIINNVPM